MGSSLVYSSANDDKELEELRRLDPALAKRVDRLLQEQFERAKSIIEKKRKPLEQIAANSANMDNCVLQGLFR